MTMKRNKKLIQLVRKLECVCLFTKSNDLEQEIKKNLAGLGYNL